MIRQPHTFTIPRTQRNVSALFVHFVVRGFNINIALAIDTDGYIFKCLVLGTRDIDAVEEYAPKLLLTMTLMSKG